MEMLVYFVFSFNGNVCFSFLETNVPLLVLVEAARTGNEKEVEEYAQVCGRVKLGTIIIIYFIIIFFFCHFLGHNLI